MAELTRDMARASFKDAGLTYEILTPENVSELRRRIDQRMRASGLIRNTYRMRRTKVLRCKSYYFEDREAVTFNRDGFIGLGGWADDTNIQPILEGFLEWVQRMGDTNG
ncbi:hypothetical protein I2750_19900 [Bacillus sp. PR5]|nr:hypothetical protein [Bacillus sp. PR5]